MAVIENLYTGDGATVLFSFTFPYLDTTHIKVSLNAVDTTEYTLANATTVQFNTAPALNDAIRIYRDTSVEQKEAVFFGGAQVKANDLNDNFDQILYVAQELEDSFQDVETDVTNAVSTANSALAQVAALGAPVDVANVAAIPGSPSLNDVVRVVDSTGIQSFTPLTGIPGGFTGDSGLNVTISWNGATWVWVRYEATDPDNRYLQEVADSSITAAKLASNAVTTAKITDANVTAAKLASDSVTTAKIVDANVTSDKLANNSVVGDRITAGAVTETKLGNNAVATAKIADEAVTTAKLAASSVTDAKIGANVLTPQVSDINDGQLAGHRNKIINGAMSVWQRGTENRDIATGQSRVYIPDRFSIDKNVGWSVAYDGDKEAADITGAPELLDAMKIVCTTAQASVGVDDRHHITYRMEGYDARPLANTTFTLSFWVRSSVTGTYCVAFKDTDLTVRYVTEYTIDVADTWEKKTITVTGGLPVGSTGVWNNEGSTGLRILWMLSAGTNYQTGSTDTWGAGSESATSNQVNHAATVNNEFLLTGVQLEVGSVATPFEVRLRTTELNLCQRYYLRVENSSLGMGTNMRRYQSAVATWYAGHMMFPSIMRAVPTITIPGAITYNSCSTLEVGSVTQRAVALRVTATSGGSAYSVSIDNGNYVDITAELT